MTKDTQQVYFLAVFGDGGHSRVVVGKDALRQAVREAYFFEPLTDTAAEEERERWANICDDDHWTAPEYASEVRHWDERGEDYAVSITTVTMPLPDALSRLSSPPPSAPQPSSSSIREALTKALRSLALLKPCGHDGDSKTMEHYDDCELCAYSATELAIEAAIAALDAPAPTPAAQEPDSLAALRAAVDALVNFQNYDHSLESRQNAASAAISIGRAVLARGSHLVCGARRVVSEVGEAWCQREPGHGGPHVSVDFAWEAAPPALPETQPSPKGGSE